MIKAEFCLYECRLEGDRLDWPECVNMTDSKNNDINIEKRPSFPKRAIVTAGMPYGNKELHFGHVGGVFIPADMMARFLRDRIGSENVLFISGTDCYGSTIEEGFEKQKENGGYTDILEYIKSNHEKQKSTLEKFYISLDLFAASAFGEAGEIHKKVSCDIFEKFYTSGALKLDNAYQFYDEEAGAFLNGRQVVGRCPISGCKSEAAYANECALGHQYMEQGLINPISTLTGKRPVLKPTQNWYIDMEKYRDALIKRQDELRKRDNVRENLIRVTDEFYRDPTIYVKREFMPQAQTLSDMPEYTVTDDEKKPSVTLTFSCLADREKACEILNKNDIRYRTGKTIVPFRISGNGGWGIAVPEKDGVNGRTFWVWPESLWAPISFTKAALKMRGCDDDEWLKWWTDDGAEIYQFIGEDNIYFYGIAEMAMFMAASKQMEKGLRLPNIIPNRHVFFMGNKASSSGKIKPPMADRLLDYYTPEQMRMHFLGMALSTKSVSFSPRAFAPEDAKPQDNFDPALKEGSLLTNVFNRLVRSGFYSLQKYFGGILPYGEVSAEVKEKCDKLILKYEECMYKYEFNAVIEELDLFVRDCNKRWSAISREAKDDAEAMGRLLIDTFHEIRVLTTLYHPIAPAGCEMIRKYLRVPESVWNWDNIFEEIYFFFDNADNHEMKFLEPRIDFFAPHESQIKK